MIYLFWPGRAIPDWLLHVKVREGGTAPPIIEHRGWGVVVKYRGRLFAYLLQGIFSYIDAKGGSLHITGGGDSLTVKGGPFKTTGFYLESSDAGKARIGTYGEPGE